MAPFPRLPVLPFSLKKVAQLAIEALLEVEGGHNVWIGLADKEVVHIEGLGQTPHGQVLLQRAISPSPLSRPH